MAGFPTFDAFMAQKLGAGARLQTAMTWQDTYLEYIGRALERLVNAAPAGDNGDGGDDGGNGGGTPPVVGYTELIDPRLDNWAYFTKDFKDITIAGIGGNASNSYNLYSYVIDEWGSVLVSSIRVSSPDCRMTVKVYSADGQYLDINNTAAELLALGRVTAPTGLGLDLNKYDTASNLYAFELRAPWPGLPFYKKVEIWLTNETASAITLKNATVTLIKLGKGI